MRDGRQAERERCAFVRHYQQLYRQQAGRCALSWRPSAGAAAGDSCPYAISIDRIDSLHGYHAGCVRLVCQFVNNALKRYRTELLVFFARQIAATTESGGARVVPDSVTATDSVCNNRDANSSCCH